MNVSGGATGAGLVGIANAQIHLGVDLVCKGLDMGKHLSDADFVITGKGQ